MTTLRASHLAGLAVIACSLPVAGAAPADEPLHERFGAGDIAISGGIDVLNLFGDELVYFEDGTLMSRLVWDTQAAFGLTAGLRAGLTARTSIHASVTAGLLADSFMTDLDWLGRPFSDAITNASWHPDTALDHYWVLDAGLRHDIRQDDAGSIGIVGGLRYTDVQWSAHGGSYDYWGEKGDFPDGQLVITYRQAIPAAYAGFAATIDSGNWTFDGRAVAGLTFRARDVDDHWLRNTRFEERYPSSLYLGLKADAAYALSPTARLTFGGALDWHDTMKGPTTITDTITGDVFFIPGDAAGAALRAIRFNAGLNVRF